MGVIVILIVASLAMALLFLGGFIWSVRSGQFEDTTTPSMRVLLDEPKSGRVITQPGARSLPSLRSEGCSQERKTGAEDHL
jgi:cbb3-type cytochrome oxidase maturation protein